MAFICAKCGSANLKKFYPGTDRQYYQCLDCREVDNVEGEEEKKPPPEIPKVDN